MPIDLTQKKCIPCEGGTPPMAHQQVQQYCTLVSVEWQVVENDKKIRRTFKFKNFKEALAFANQVGEIAEAEGHHPDLVVAWGRVEVTLWTHAVGGLSENDFIMAAKIDALSQ